MNYFEDELHFRELTRELISWKGTKYSHTGICLKGIGSDCVRFVLAVLVATGSVPPIPLPKYVPKNGGPGMLELLIKTLESMPLKRVWKSGDGAIPENPKRGWILVISTGRALHHLAIVGNPPQAWHCLDKVEECNYLDPSIQNHIFSIYEVNG